MNFDPKNFRRFSEESCPSITIREGGGPLILVKATGEASYANTRLEMDALIGKFEPSTDLLLFAWVGRYKTDVFMLSADDIAKHYR